MPTGIGIGITAGVDDSTPGAGAPGYSNLYSIDFDGVSEYLQASSTPLFGTLGTGDWSVSFWMRPSNIAVGAHQRLWSFGAGGTVQTQMYINSAGTHFQFAGPWTDSYNYPLVDDTWYHVVYAVGRAGATASVSYYIDGANPNSTTKTYAPAFDTTGSSFIGRNSGSYKYQGFFDEFSIWNTQLTQADANTIYNGGSPSDLSTIGVGGLQHWWRMGDPTGTASYPTILDAAGGGISMAMTNMTSANITTTVP